ncbi:MAG: hypothetical protein A2698_01735 [Candidatus Levybacteria bacterium RIFCSPHIGHO2_01_FULL_42_15]|nr:MAG: hypothetical protein A2698_01735 [Candidatus Levybacteria bacterium RIFCSPHIGHO2_01_FULL_42_15]
MVAFGARIRWKNGDILHPSIMWKSPSKRRLPRLLIENRALEVAVLVYVEEPWVIFHETNLASKTIGTEESTPLEFYVNRFYLLPQKLKRQDAYQWMRKPKNAILVWGVGSEYYAKPVRRQSFL